MYILCYNVGMPYKVGKKGTYGCEGYPALKDDGTVMGCHATAKEAAGQIYAINRSEGNIGKAMVSVGDFVIANCDDEIYIGRVEHVMAEGSVGIPGSEYYMEATADTPAVVVRTLEFESDGGYWEETSYLVNVSSDEVVAIAPLPLDAEAILVDGELVPEMMDKADECCPEETLTKADPCWEGYTQRGMKPGENGRMVPNCVPVEKADDMFEDDDDVVYETDSVEKAEGYSPPAGARAAARKAIKFKEDGKAKGAGTAVGWTRAGQLARGETLSLSTVKRMYSYFSRHEVDKKGKDWGNQANPSNGYIMWLAWGGDAGFSWSRGIVRREMDKALFSNLGKDYTKPVALPNLWKD
jgi:hypothetical protein